MRKSIIIFLFCFLWAGLVVARGVEAVLLPTKPGTPSQIVYPSSKVGVEYLIQYDCGECASILVGLDDADTLGVWFQSPAACTLLEIHFCTQAYSDPTQLQYNAFAAWSDQTLNCPNDWNEYHIGDPIAGPSPIDSIIVESTLTSDSTDWDWDTLVVVPQPDVGKDIFFAGYAFPDTINVSPNPRVCANIEPPYHALIWRETPANGGPPGWYSSWHLFWIRALVRMYEPPERDPWIVEWDRLSYTYSTRPRTVTANVIDIWGPPDSLGVVELKLIYSVNNANPDTLFMSLVSGDSLDGVYSADIPGQSALDTISYFIYARDAQYHIDTTYSQTYVIMEKRENFLFVNLDYYGYPYTYDPINTLYGGRVDYCTIPPDTFFLHAYNTIVWNSWGEYYFAMNEDFFRYFLDNGGNLWLSDQDGINEFTGTWERWHAAPGNFIYDYMRLVSGIEDFTNDSVITLYTTGDTITMGLPTSITIYPYRWAGVEYNFSGMIDTFTTANPATGTFYYSPGEFAGIWYEDTTKGYKLVFTFFPFAYMVKQNKGWVDDTSSLNILTENILTWFGYPLVGIEENAPIPFQISSLLNQNRPNPVSKKTAIIYSIPEDGKVSLKVYNATGALIRTLVNKPMKKGNYTTYWDIRNDKGREVASGVYFCRLETTGFTGTRKIVVVK